MLGPKPPNIFTFQILIAFSEILLACQNCNAQFLYGNNCSIGLDTYTECTGCKIIAFFIQILYHVMSSETYPFIRLEAALPTAVRLLAIPNSRVGRPLCMPHLVKL